MTTEMEINITSESLNQLNYIMDANNLPNTKNAFDHVVHAVKNDWKSWAMGGSIDGIDDIKHPNNKLMQSIKEEHQGDFKASVYTNNKYMERIESGTKELDMKETHPYGRRSRVNKITKIPYLIIPFRWGSEKERAHFRGNVAPSYLVEYLKKQQASRKLPSTHNEPNFYDEQIPRQEYKWGGRVTEDIADDDRQIGMVRMQDLGNKGTYFTFRIISADSPANSWIRKAVPPIPVTRTITEINQPLAEEALAEGLKQDIESL